MERLNLLCDEVWPMSPRDVSCNEEEWLGCNDNPSLPRPTEQDCEEAIRILLEKEDKYVTESGYLVLVQTDELVGNARCKGVHWILRSQRRMDLSVGTVFTAVNYLDRFISLPQCRGWKYWMFELLPVACLTVASKFNETTPPPLQEFQEGLENSFAPSLIQSMELRLLKELGWRMDSVTPFSYIHLLIQTIDEDKIKKPIEEFMNRVTRLLLRALLDPRFLELRPCIAAIAAVRCIFQDLSPSRNDDSLAHWDAIVPQNHKDDLTKCQSSMREKMLEQDQHENALIGKSSWPGPASPVTVLKEEPPSNFGDCRVNVSIMNSTRSSRKRKRGEQRIKHDANGNLRF